METINTISYPVIIGGMSYNLEVKTANASSKVSEERAKQITEILKAVLCTHFSKDGIEELSMEQATSVISYTREGGAFIGGKKVSGKTDEKVRAVFLDTFRNGSYKGLNAAKESNRPLISELIEDMYNIQTSAQATGKINPANSSGWSWIYDGVKSAALGAYHAFKGKDFEEEIKDPTKLSQIRQYIKNVAAGKANPNDLILNAAVRQLKKENVTTTARNIKAKIHTFLDILNKEPAKKADKIGSWERFQFMRKLKI